MPAVHTTIALSVDYPNSVFPPHIKKCYFSPQVFSFFSYAEIRSPIAGTVIERDIEVGRTIVSDSEAGLFIIAEDLANMQIEALVDETDIGQITEGMAARFTVQAYPDDEFAGTVRQIRLNPIEEQNVVSYIVIVDAQNDTGTLLPGMTATGTGKKYLVCDS